jgi:DNA-binding Xre family transcriptional regulator
MTSSPPIDYTQRLQVHMKAANIHSFRTLGQMAKVTKRSVQRLRDGEADTLRGDMLHRLAQALNLSVSQLLNDFSTLDGFIEPPSADRRRVQLEVLQQIEPWMVQWPTAVYAVKTNPHIPASRLLPLLRPLEQLLHRWDIEPTAPVGMVVIYDPQEHQLLEGEAEPGDPVLVRYTGYRQGDRLLHRAKVSPAPPED